MINVGSNKFAANNIFLQPTYSCAKACQGCYAKEKEAQFGSGEMALPIWHELISDIVHTQHKIATKQVTLALDTLNYNHVGAWNKMYSIASMYFQALWMGKAEDLQAHVTVNCISDLKEYAERFHDRFKRVDMLSISNINKLSDIEEAREIVPGAAINWNVMSGTFAAKDPEQMKAIVRKVDSVYLLLHKSPLGVSGHSLKSLRLAEQSSGHDFNKFFAGLKQIDSLRPTAEDIAKQDIFTEASCPVPPLSNKINVDGCMSDAAEFNRKGHGCSSNISRFQIWPDGRVTGCAYNSHNQYGKNALSLSDVLNNLWDARNRYEFKQCTIPQDLINLRDKKHLQVAE